MPRACEGARPAAAGPAAGAERGGPGAALRPHLPRSGLREGRRKQLDPAGPLPPDRDPLRQTPAPAEPVADPAARGVPKAKGPPYAPQDRRGGAASLRKRGLRAAPKTAAEAHRDKRIALRFQDEMRVGRKGRLRHRRRSRGRRPPGRQDRRFEWSCVFGAARPDGKAAFGLVMPEVGAQAMQTYLDAFEATIPEEKHAVFVGEAVHRTVSRSSSLLDRAVQHCATALRVPPNVA